MFILLYYMYSERAMRFYIRHSQIQFLNQKVNTYHKYYITNIFKSIRKQLNHIKLKSITIIIYKNIETEVTLCIHYKINYMRSSIMNVETNHTTS